MALTLSSPRARASTIAVPALALCLLTVWPALYNGFPLYFSDSAVYITGTIYPGIPPAYPLIALVLSKISLWIPPLFSGIITIFVVWCLLARWFSLNPMSNLAVIAVTLAATKLAWVNSLLMPDIYGGLSCAAALALIGRFDLKPTSVGLLIVIFAGLTFQTASFGVIALTIIISIIILRSWRPVHWALSIVLGVAMAVVFASNLAIFGRLSVNPSGSVAFFSKLVYAGAAQEYLAENCGRERMKVCDYLSELAPMKGDDDQPFLWKRVGGDGRSIAAITGLSDPNNEYSRLVVRIILQYPLVVAKGALTDTYTLILAEGQDLQSYKDQGPTWPFKSLYARDKRSFEMAKQQNSALPQEIVNRLAQITTIGSVPLLIIFAVIGRHRTIVLLTLGTWLANAMVHGTLVGAFERYQDKVNWLLPMILLAIVAEWHARRDHVAAGRSSGKFLETD